jgi:GNAT superfamily N-acetyltransferase
MHTEDQTTTVRRAEANDLDRLVEIYVASCHIAYADVLNASYHQFLDDNAANGTWKQTYEHHLGALSTIVLVIEKATQIEGFAILTAKGNGNGKLDELFFHPSAMGKGLGTILFDAVITQARALNITKLTLEVVEQNVRALAFHPPLSPHHRGPPNHPDARTNPHRFDDLIDSGGRSNQHFGSFGPQRRSC